MTTKTASKKTATKKKPTRKKAATKKTPVTSAKAKPKTDDDAPKRVSLLDAAAIVLADAEFPMAVRAIVEEAVSRGLWTSPSGKTPHATLHAAMMREINKRKEKSRFAKVDRGRFALASNQT